jgi:hypoxanthine phosphoribosyltransferase
MVEKEFIRADDLVRESFDLAKRIYDSGFIPDVLLVLWRGGTPVGIVIHEFLLYKGIETYQPLGSKSVHQCQQSQAQCKESCLHPPNPWVLYPAIEFL